MSRVSIYESNWINLVFEGKNKAYGAYQLRQEHPRTTFLAFILGLLCVSIFAIVMLLLPTRGIAAPKTDVELYGTTITLDNIKPNLPSKDVAFAAAKSEKPKEVVEANDLRDPEIVTVDKADVLTVRTDPTAILSTEVDLGLAATTTGFGSATAIGTKGTSTTASTTVEDDSPQATLTLDKMPQFPGGIAKFYQYIANNFEKPEIDETVNVLMAFVIEKDGSMTHITVLRNPGHGLDKEAVRVLKSLRTKWEPGIKNGKPVRTQYTLPIKVTRY